MVLRVHCRTFPHVPVPLGHSKTPLGRSHHTPTPCPGPRPNWPKVPCSWPVIGSLFGSSRPDGSWSMRQIEQMPSAWDAAAVFVAMELSKSAWLLAAQGSPSGKASSHRLEGGDIAGLLVLLRRLQAREQQACGRPVQIILGYEAGYDGFWLQRRLSSEGIPCCVMDPGSLQVDRRARRAKTDCLDAAMLLRALMAWWRGDRAACHIVQVPSVEREDARRTHRERQRLIAERVQHVNRMKGLLATQGIYDYRPLRRDRWEGLEDLPTGDGRELPPRLRREIEREFKRLELVLEQIAATEAERDAAVAAPTADDADAAMVARLAKLGGIGPELATVLVREALYRPFTNRKEVAAYAGLTPSPYASGDKHPATMRHLGQEQHVPPDTSERASLQLAQCPAHPRCPKRQTPQSL